MNSRPVQRALTASDGNPVTAALVLDYVEAGHWYKLIVCFHELTVYFFEPFGSRLDADHPIVDAFEQELHTLDEQWRFTCIELKVQTDGVSCGVWDLVADQAFVAYVDSKGFGSLGFGSFLHSWLLDRGVTDLHTVGGRATSRRAFAKRNELFITEQRAQFRERLLHAAQTGRLAWHDGPLVDVFATGARMPPEELDALDD